ncbi:site-specific integrase [Carnobacterium sp. CS13]|nr:site-specific integrase [Carnobacterium sp. CS13]QQP71168.1 site-specific integrase [Carnobacterium sp. CS13]
MATYTKLKSGWRYRTNVVVNEERIQLMEKGFRTKREAQAAAEALESRLRRGGSVLDGNSPFIDYFENWYKVFRKGKFSNRNDRDILLSISVAKRFFKKTKLKEIDKVMYQSFLNDYGNGHATATVKKIHTYTRACLRDAHEAGAIIRDPSYRAFVKGTVEAQKESSKYLSQTEASLLLKETISNLNPMYASRYMIVFGLATGCRFSETLGLTWDCVDFKNKTVRINKTWDYEHKHDFAPTKNKSSNRVITIDDQTLSILNELKLYQAKRQLSSGLRNKKNLVFIDRQLTLTSNAGMNKTLKRLCVKAGVQEITSHSLRHTHASIMIYNDLNIKYISKRLGHETIVTTLQTYGHIIDELSQRESEQVSITMNDLYTHSAESGH